MLLLPAPVQPVLCGPVATPEEMLYVADFVGLTTTILVLGAGPSAARPATPL